jgi:uncharacterized protein YndB with AHSA1/START domain
MNRECRQQTLIDAPVRVVWELVADPNRQEEWWPSIVDAECDQFEQGCRFRAVIKNPRGKLEEHHFTVDRLDDCHEVLIRCDDIGTYTRFLLTEAQGRTFLDAQFGIVPQTLGMQAFTVMAGRRVLRRWLDETVEALQAASVERARAQRPA